MPPLTLSILVAAGGALVAQNLMMAKMTGAVSTVLVALVMNSAVGLIALSALLFREAGAGAVSEVLGAFRPWFVIPGLLGSFFVFASITGYQRLGAAPTISVLVASQLIFGIACDLARSEKVTAQGLLAVAFGAALLIAGVLVILSRYR